jgi:hypothetical protein
MQEQYAIALYTIIVARQLDEPDVEHFEPPSQPPSTSRTHPTLRREREALRFKAMDPLPKASPKRGGIMASVVWQFFQQNKNPSHPSKVYIFPANL